MIRDLIPTNDEMEKQLICTLQHSFRVEYYLHRLELGRDDPQRPHDLVGEGNKFSWDVIRGLAFAYRKDPELNTELNKWYIEPARELHRKQHHHQMWNYCHPKATADNMKLGASDAICAMLEDRPYQKGPYSFEEIESLVYTFPRHPIKDGWIKKMLPYIREIKTPDFNVIQLHEVPNLGLPAEMYVRIVERLEETLDELAGKGYKFK